MLSFNGAVASMQNIHDPIVDVAAHPPVYKTVTFEAGGSAYTKGELLAYDADEYAVSYDSDSGDSTANIVGVLTQDIDASGDDDVSALMLWHGAVKQSELTVEGGAPSTSDLGALENTGRIFLV